MNIQSLVKQAETHHHAGKLKLARNFYIRALDVDSNCADALYGFATLLMQQGELVAANNNFIKAADNEPKAPDIAYNHAQCLVKMGQLQQAVESLDRAYRHCGRDPHFLSAIASLLLQLRKPQEALKVIAGLPENSKGKALLAARACGEMKDWGRAITLLDQQNQQSPNDKDILRELSVAAARLRDYTLAIKSYEQYLSLIEVGPAEYLKLSDLYLMARRLDDAETSINKVFSSAQEDGESWALRARIERLNGRYKNARESADCALRAIPYHGVVWGLRVEMAEDDELSELKVALKKALTVSDVSDYHRTMMLYALGDLFEKMEDWNSALENWSWANKRQEALAIEEKRDYDFVKMASIFSAIKEFYPELNRSSLRENRNIKPIFIVGMPRSGTTLVERILGQIDSVEMCGENEAMAFIAAQYNQDVERGVKPKPAKMSQEQWALLARRYEVRTPHQKTVLTDKLPHNVQNVGFILSCFPDAKIIQMRRHPMDVCLSIYQRSFPEGHNYANDFETLAHFYRQTDELMDHWASIASDSVLNVKYEELVSNPHVHARWIVEFCKLPWSDDCLEFHKQVKASFTFSEMQVRKSLNTKRIARWRKFENLIRPLADALEAEGYQVTT